MLKHIPTNNDLMRLYWELSQLGASCKGEKKKWTHNPQSKEELVILACDMLRHDPRLLTILIIYFIHHWQEINPYFLRKNMIQMNTPQTLGVIREFLVEIESNRELIYFFDYIIRSLKPVPPQLFFIGLFHIGSPKHLMMAQKSLRSYKKWGFLSTERPAMDIYKKKIIGSYDFDTRQTIIQLLLKRKKVFFLKDYLEALNYSISRQQALYDLKRSRHLKLVGYGRGAQWKKVA